MDCTNQDFVGEDCVRNDAGKLTLTDKDKTKAWVEHYARLLNVEFEWLSNELTEVSSTAGSHGKYITTNKLLYFAFVDLEKAFDRVPRKILWWALRSLWVE